MKSAALVLALLVVACFALENSLASLEHEHEATRLGSLRIARVTTANGAASKNTSLDTPVASAVPSQTIAALSIQLPGHPELLYARSRGRWRCVSAFGAPASESQISAIVGAIEAMAGMLRGGYNEASAFGFDEARTRRIRLHGPALLSDPERDIVHSIELGISDSERGFTFVRKEGTAEILEVAAPWIRSLEWPIERTLPPLLDNRILAGSWASGRPDWTHIFIDVTEGESIELRARALADGKVWEIRGAQQADNWETVLPYRMIGFLTYLVRATYSGLADPKERAQRGCDPPSVRITLIGQGADPVRLDVGSASPGGFFVWNDASRSLLQSRQERDWLAPSRSMLMDRAIANPWERWLSR